MGKLLFWVAVIIFIMFVIRLLNHKKAQKRHEDQAAASAPPELKESEAMVRCEHCGVYLPRSDAVLMHERLWCSTEHAKLGPKQR